MSKDNGQTVRQIVRLRGIDLNGLLSIERAIQKIPGIGCAIARALRVKFGINETVKLGELNETQLKAFDNLILNIKNSIPTFMLNKRKDYETGQNLHLTSVDLDMGVKADVSRMRTIKSYKGVRHAAGLKVRGQRTKSTGRGSVAVGVVKKKLMPAKKEQ